MEENSKNMEYQSYGEYKKRFFPKSTNDQTFEAENSRILGVALARETLKKVFTVEQAE